MVKRKINSNRRRAIADRVILTGVAVTMFLFGRFLAPAKIETVAKTVTVEVPTYTERTIPSETDVTYLDIPLSHNLQRYITDICSDEGVPVALVYAMIEHESQFDEEAVSGTNDYGLMQINSINSEYLEKEYKVTDLLNPYQNVFCGVKVIGSYLTKYEGNCNKALMAYNMGDYGAQKAWLDGIESSSYSRTILALMSEYEQELANGTDNED